MKKTPENIIKILKNLPKTPGVYQMKNASGTVIYVGKAINLYSRVNSYFREGQLLTAAKKNMVSQIADIEIILCSSEVEALTLETNLIKHLSPKYNILMKDDKNMSYIKISQNVVAEVLRTRQKLSDGAKYFGPYAAGANIAGSLKTLRRIFKIRACRMKFSHQKGKIEITDRAGRGIPCMDYYIGICPAPCLLKAENLQKHAENIENFEKFLRGNTSEVMESLNAKMREFAKNLEFEKANEMKTEIAALEMLSERQIARDAIPGDHDAAVLYEKYGQFFLGLTKIRDGKIIAVFRFVVEGKNTTADEAFLQFLARQYVGEVDDLPKIILIENPIDDAFLEKFFAEKNIEIASPKIGAKKEILDFTKNQLREYAYKKELQSIETKTLTRGNMENVLEQLGYETPKKWPISFECYDISHTHGQFTYASRVVITNGKPDTSSYKKYKIKTLSDGEIDDFASHKEVMYRRTIEGILQNNFSHLIIIDGGKWQLSSAISGILEAIGFLLENEKNSEEKPLQNFLINRGINMEDFLKNFSSFLPFISEHDDENPENFLEKFFGIQMCSIAKREEEIFLPNQKNPVLFEKGTGELMVLQKARDESHRFSITANRSARTKSMKKNMLEELPGIGSTTRKKLLKLAGNIDGIRDLSEEEIGKIVNKKQLETLRDHGIY